MWTLMLDPDLMPFSRSTHLAWRSNVLTYRAWNILINLAFARLICFHSKHLWTGSTVIYHWTKLFWRNPLAHCASCVNLFVIVFCLVQQCVMHFQVCVRAICSVQTRGKTCGDGRIKKKCKITSVPTHQQMCKKKKKSPDTIFHLAAL